MTPLQLVRGRSLHRARTALVGAGLDSETRCAAGRDVRAERWRLEAFFCPPPVLSFMRLPPFEY